MANDRYIDETRYMDFFGVQKKLKKGKYTPLNKFAKRAVAEKALETALDIRKFEIDLFWKRAKYFFTVIFLGLFTKLYFEDNKEEMSFVLLCMGMYLSWCWYFVNRGSKFWQENWERHVDLLEDEFHGPLYKMVYRGVGRENTSSSIHVFSSGSFSVGKIAIMKSMYISIVVTLVVAKACVSYLYNVNGICFLRLTRGLCLEASVVIVTLIFLWLAVYKGRTSFGVQPPVDKFFLRY